MHHNRTTPPICSGTNAAELFEDRLLSRSEVQAYFGLKKRFLEVAASRGDGPPMLRIGRSVRYRVGDLRDWIEARRVTCSAGEVQQ
ncbi:helix-turn-helix transcriptional regulator [Rhodovulum sp. YNF3179]|uniref:helix-turn-helix transcriptional regulator n=1 Tax=Rhodovulum sp. YNF3179 TaxID=3425127 RepID=UPI003D33C02B